MSIDIPTVNEIVRYAYEEVNEEDGRPLWHDQSKGNQCHRITYKVMSALGNRSLAVRRERHEDDIGNWHYILAHEDPESEPNEGDFMTDVNPWQWKKGFGENRGPIHAPRQELMERLQTDGAPDYVIALRSLATLEIAHDSRRL